MNWAAVAAIGSIVGVFCTVVMWVFWGGKMTQRVDDHHRRLDGNDELIGSHADRIANHDAKIAHLEGWKEGFDAGSRTSSN